MNSLDRESGKKTHTHRYIYIYNKENRIKKRK